MGIQCCMGFVLVAPKQIPIILIPSNEIQLNKVKIKRFTKIIANRFEVDRPKIIVL